MFYLIPADQPNYDISSVEGWIYENDLNGETANYGLIQLDNGNFEDLNGQEWEIVER